MLINRKQLIMQKLINTRVHLGFRTTYSDFQPYLYGFRNEMAIINLEITLTCLRRACNAIDLIMRSKGHLLIVNTNMEYNKLVRQTAKYTKQSYVNYKWIGGLLTNWNHMQNVQRHFQDFASNTKLNDVFSNHKLNPSLLSYFLETQTSNNATTKKYDANGDKNTNTKANANANTSIDTSQKVMLLNKHSVSPVFSEQKVALFSNDALNQFKQHKNGYSLNQSDNSNIELDVDEHSPSLRVLFQNPLVKSDTLNKKTQELHSTLYSFPRFKKMAKCFEGIIAKELPDCILVMNATQNYNAINEAAKLQIPVIALVDSNIPNSLHHKITYPIPANQNSFEFMYLFCNCIIKTINASKKTH